MARMISNLVVMMPPWVDAVSEALKAAIDQGWVPVDGDKLLEDLGTMIGNQMRTDVE